MKKLTLTTMLAALVCLLTVPGSALAAEAEPAPTPTPYETEVTTRDMRTHTDLSGTFTCDGVTCSGDLVTLQTGDAMPLEVSDCDLGDECILSEAQLRDGTLTILRHHSSAVSEDGSSVDTVKEQELRVVSDRGSTTLHSVEVESTDGLSSTTNSYTVDGRSVSRAEYAEVANAVAEAFPEIQVTYKATNQLADDVAFIDLGNGTGYLGCLKQCVDDCGGTHNDGDCDDFSWSDGGDGGTEACVLICAAGCGVQHPFGVFACAAAALF